MCFSDSIVVRLHVRMGVGMAMTWVVATTDGAFSQITPPANSEARDQFAHTFPLAFRTLDLVLG